MNLPPMFETFPDNRPTAIVWFWVRYWLWFLALLPYMLARQAVEMTLNAVMLARTWNRVVPVTGTPLRIVHLNTLRTLPASLIWGERIQCIHYGDVLIDPGPPCTRHVIARYLSDPDRPPIRAVVVTHHHEEHLGNAAFVAAELGVPAYGSALTLRRLREPEELSLPRRTFMGEVSAAHRIDARTLSRTLDTPSLRLRVIDSPGHCAGHVSLFDPHRRVLIAGDSFLHTVFTSPNGDVRCDTWMQTLERYAQLPIDTMIGGHGCLYTRRLDVPANRILVRHEDPHTLIHEKLRFTRWARRMLAESERRGLAYSVIEATLFPWTRPWTSRNWFRDEAIRLFSAGEFSRTHFVRSLSTRPQRVPPRFPRFAQLKDRVARRWTHRRHAMEATP